MMDSYSQNNKRIAKNTILLYIRTFVVMLISLYTSRVILDALGVVDYGVYQVVGGVVAMFSVVSSSLSNAIGRFITFAIGKGDKENIKRIFSTSLTIQIVISLIVLILSEVVGMWFIETEMKIPVERLDAAQWVLHCSLITFCINLLSVPYNACIIAHERMTAFAYFGVFDAVIRLAICFCVKVSPIDKLIFYAILMALLALTMRIIYAVYCNRHFEESRVGAGFDKKIFKEMFGFSSWSFFNNTSFILNNQGVNMLMNVYFGVVVNAARGIAVQVENAVLNFVNNFTMAINPQITKSYASGDLTRMYSLICRGAKFSYFAMLFISLPIIIEAKLILDIWLVDVPEYSVIFVQLSLIMGMCDSIGNSGYTACMATGKIRKYSLIITSIACLEFPLAWAVFAFGALPEYAYYTYIFIKILVLIVRMYLMQSMVGLKVEQYVKSVFIPVISTTIVAIAPSMVISYFLESGFIRLIIICLVSFLSVAVATLYIGMTKNERNVILSKCGSIISKFRHN